MRSFTTFQRVSSQLSKWRRHFLRRVTVVVFYNIELSLLGAFDFMPEDYRVLKGEKYKEFCEIILCMLMECVLA